MADPDRDGKVTIGDVARAAGVSVATVSNALRGKGRMSEQTRSRVLRTVRELGFHPSSKGPGAGRRILSVVLLVEELATSPERDAFVGKIIDGVSRFMAARAVDLRIHVVGQESSGEGELPDALFHPSVKGIIALAGGAITDQYVETLRTLGLPMVLVDNFSRTRPMHCITCDNVTGAYMVVKHLIELGHRRIGILKGPHKYKTLVERYLGFIQAMEIHGLTIDSDLIPPPIEGERTKGYSQMLQLMRLAHPPTAVFAVSDKTAFGALAAAQEVGVRIPEDVALVGFDNVAAAAKVTPGLTTVEVPTFEMGRRAAEAVLNLMEYPDQPPVRMMVPVRLVVRESCGSSAVADVSSGS